MMLATLLTIFVYQLCPNVDGSLKDCTFKDNFVAECLNSKYKFILKYFLNKEEDSLDSPDKNNITQILERNSALFGFLIKKNESFHFFTLILVQKTRAK